MKNLTTLLLLIFALQACGDQTNSKNQDNKALSPTMVQPENPLGEPDLTITLPASEDRRIPNRWKSLEAIPNGWVEVKKDKDGYLIYEPCDGNTRRISIKDGYLHILWQMEPEYRYSYEKFTRITGEPAFRLTAFDYDNEEFRRINGYFPTFELSADIVDAENGLVLFSFSDQKWLMTPADNADKFRHIKNNCPDFKRREIDFEPIDFN